MLIIRRRQGETILIGEDIEIEIVESGSARVKLGIRAPRHVSVQRKEVLVVRKTNLAAAALGADERASIANRLRPETISQLIPPLADKASEARYTGHPETQENPGPA